MGAFLDKPKTEKYNESGSACDGQIRYGLASMQGWRIEMEDAHAAVLGLPGLDQSCFFAVFDGHAGSRVSAHCAKHLLSSILTEGDANDRKRNKRRQRRKNEEDQKEDEEETENNDNGGDDDDDSDSDSEWNDLAMIIKSEHTLDESEWSSKVQKAIFNGFLHLDEKLRKIPEVANGEDKSGTTAVCALVTDKYVLLSNCGDSRAVLSSDGGQPVLVTLDHKPSNPPERERIVNAGGSVMIQRVNGSLAVSRALGDFEYKNVDGKGPTEQLVSPEPEFFLQARNRDKDEFLVLACDGVWDVMSNEDICQFVAQRLKVTQDLEMIASEVIDTCLHKGSRDNMSIIIIAFPAAPKLCQDALKLEKELDTTLKQRVSDIVEEHKKEIEFHGVFQIISEETITGLPPGGGLYAKKQLLEEYFYTLCPEKQFTEQPSCPNEIANLLFNNANNSRH